MYNILIEYKYVYPSTDKYRMKYWDENRMEEGRKMTEKEIEG